MAANASGGGVMDSLRSLLATVIEIGELGLDLLAFELENERRRFFDALVLGALALMLLSFSLLALCGLVVLLMWDRYRIATVAIMALVLLCLGLISLQLARRRLQRGTGSFAGSLALLQRDHTKLRGGSSNSGH